jgi:transcriptional regulator with XRE-family HTH domain
MRRSASDAIRLIDETLTAILWIVNVSCFGESMALPIAELGRLIARKRGSRGIRTAALEADVSPATLSRVENGNVPDLATFAKICRWLEVDPSRFLGGAEDDAQQSRPAVVHFRKSKTVSPETANSLGALILAAQKAKAAQRKLMD